MNKTKALSYIEESYDVLSNLELSYVEDDIDDSEASSDDYLPPKYDPRKSNEESSDAYYGRDGTEEDFDPEEFFISDFEFQL